MDVLIDEVERTLLAAQPNRQATFADAVAAWRECDKHAAPPRAGPRCATTTPSFRRPDPGRDMRRSGWPASCGHLVTDG